MRRSLNQAEIPIGFKSTNLSATEKAQGVRVGQGSVVENFGDGGVFVRRVAGFTPADDFFLDLLVEVLHI